MYMSGLNGFMFSDSTAENITETMVAEGLVELRRGGLKMGEYVSDHFVKQC